ncbi:hypothetical protein GCM10011495_29550 [Hymenobacter frigidus]|uniref:Uncharacterized protein n=1 Tax=Hymenobacter frigidus TaxID=1524095 RepID=A0ABQ2ACT7_9BACT|nr:hypothetical protein GCM10011495_29550 [Hymenobacter frigidus]
MRWSRFMNGVPIGNGATLRVPAFAPSTLQTVQRRDVKGRVSTRFIVRETARSAVYGSLCPNFALEIPFA